MLQPLAAQGLDRFAHFAIYRLPDGQLDVLGRGGMGTTYRAFDLQLERPVALKTIHPQHLYHPEVRSRFLREAKAAARLQHPNIASVLYQGEEAGICFYAMELVSGEDLDSYVHRIGPVEPVAALQICHQAALGLDAAYQIDLLHRDLKPGNIMLTRYHDHRIPHVKVIDFGLAKFLHDLPTTLVTQAGFMGTPGYASPEQCREQAMDCRSDIYSLGATLWYMLSGKEIFEGGTLAVIQAHVSQEPDYGTLPYGTEPLIPLLQRMLAKNPEDRPETPVHLIYEIECAIEAMGGPPGTMLPPIEVKEPPPGPPPTLVDGDDVPLPVGGNRGLWLGLAGFLLLLLVLGAAFFAFGNFGNNDPYAARTEGKETESMAGAIAPSPALPTPEPAADTSEPVVPPVAEKVETSSEPTALAPVPAHEFSASLQSAPPPVSETPAAAQIAAAQPAQSEATATAPVASAPPVVLDRENPEDKKERTNSLGMRMIPLPFLGGWMSAWETRLQDYEIFARETKRKPVDIPSWKDPGFIQGPDHPVVMVSVEDAAAFCRWLTEKEMASGQIKPNQIYRLPSRLEMDAAKGRVPQEIMKLLLQKYPERVFPKIQHPEKFIWGGTWPPPENTGNFSDESAVRSGLVKRCIPGYKDNFPATAPVGSFAPNVFGFF